MTCKFVLRHSLREIWLADKNELIDELIKGTCPPLKSLFPLPSFLSQPLLKYFELFPQPSCRQPPSCHKPTYQPSLHIINGFKRISKRWFYHFTCTIYQKSIFNSLDPFTIISGHLNLWDIFRFVFRQLRINFFHKVMVAEKFFFFKCITQFCK